LLNEKTMNDMTSIPYLPYLTRVLCFSK